MAFLGSERSHKIENHELATSAQRHSDRRILRGRAGRDSIGPPRQEAGDVNALTVGPWNSKPIAPGARPASRLRGGSKTFLGLSEGLAGNKFALSSVFWLHHLNGVTQSCLLLYNPLPKAVVVSHRRSSVEF
jgi:hypothetical protein